jgi:hypothetical protein
LLINNLGIDHNKYKTPELNGKKFYEEDMVFKNTQKENRNSESEFEGNEIAKRAFTTLA